MTESTRARTTAMAIGLWAMPTRRSDARTEEGMGWPAHVRLQGNARAGLGCSSGEDRGELPEAIGPAAAMQLKPLLRGELSLGQGHHRSGPEGVE